jgi:hypothetical protein
LNDSRFGDSKRDVSNIEAYIRMGKIGRAFTAQTRTVLLIDEIDKADTDFQDDMLDVLDQMEFDIIEIDKTIQAYHRPVIIITSNAKKDLSDPFDTDLMENTVVTFYGMREIDNIEKKPATRELINWIRALQADPDFKPKRLLKDEVPYLGILFKKSQDHEQAQTGLKRRRLF